MAEKGFTKVFEILAQKVSRKAVVTVIAMLFLFLLANNPIVVTPYLILTTIAIVGLAVFFTILQWILDRKKNKETNEEK